MQNRDLIRLKHINDAIEAINEFTKGASKEEFLNNYMLNSAVVRQFEIIGEAVRQLSDNFKQEHNNIDWKNPNALRNILIHEYFKVDLEIIWKTVQTSLPEFSNKIIKLISKLE